MKANQIKRTYVDPITLQHQGLEALTQKLGVANTIRFLQFYDQGQGNYTKERGKLHSEIELSTIIQRIKERKK